MTFNFTTQQLSQLQSELSTAQQIVQNNPNTQGAYVSAYQLLYSMITTQDADGDDIPRNGVEPGAWMFIEGVDRVNANHVSALSA